MVYQNDVDNISVAELWDEFEFKYANHPIQFENVFELDGNTTILKLDFFPISYTTPVSVKKKEPTDTDYVDFNEWVLDYEQGIIRLTTTFPTGTSIKFQGFYRKINLKQFVKFLESSIRFLYVYFPIKAIVEYNPGVDINHIDLTGLNLLDVKKIYADLNDKTTLNFTRRGQYVYFIDNNLKYEQTVNSDYYNWADYGNATVYQNTTNKLSNDINIDSMNNIVVSTTVKPPIYIEGTLKLFSIKWYDDIDTTLNQVFKWHRDVIEPILIKVGVFMYQRLLHLNTRINVSNLQLDTRFIGATLNELKREIAVHTDKTKRGRLFYQEQNPTLILNSTL